MAASAAPRFNLGILQALAENQLLHKFDYLSTLSGGGYIGSWLAASTYRLLTTLPNSSFRDVEKALVPGKREPGGREERTFLRWLRLYSNYLTPHTGVLPGDTWAMIGTWLRNVFLNQTVLGLLFLGVFVCCHGVLLGLMRSSRLGATGLLFAGVLAWFIAAVSMAVNVPDQILSKEMLLTAFQRVKVTVMVILPFFLACLLLNSGLWRWRDVKANLPLWMWLAGCGAFYFVAWGGGGGTDEAVERDAGEENPGRTDAFPYCLLVFRVCRRSGRRCPRLQLHKVAQPHVTGSSFSQRSLDRRGLRNRRLDADPVARRRSAPRIREWWARLGGYMMLLTLAWLLLAGSCALGPLLVRWVIAKLQWGSIVPAGLWVAHNYLGVKAASSAVGRLRKSLRRTPPAGGGSYGYSSLLKFSMLLPGWRHMFSAWVWCCC